MAYYCGCSITHAMYRAFPNSRVQSIFVTFRSNLNTTRMHFSSLRKQFKILLSNPLCYRCATARVMRKDVPGESRLSRLSYSIVFEAKNVHEL